MAADHSRTPAYPGEESQWAGFRRHDFTCAGKAATIIRPHQARPGLPWVWRARFLGAFPMVDEALLADGFHLGFLDTARMFGAPPAMALWDQFYDYCVDTLGWSPMVVLEGFSRGGLFVYNWAARRPDRVVCIYADAPVCDLRSWPAGRFSGPGAPVEWEHCRAIHGWGEEDPVTFNRSPIDILGPIAAARIPIIHVCGGADEIVPIAENTYVLRERLQALGHDLTLIEKPGCGHHPHSLEDPTPVVEFIRRAWAERGRG